MNTELLGVISVIAQGRQIPLMLVGGAVRDLLQGKPIHDYDFAVLGNPATTEKLARACANRLKSAFYIMDAERGTCRVIVDGLNLDFAAVRGASFDDDLHARDFTVNAIGILMRGQVTGHLVPPVPESVLYDPLHGARDLKLGVIRMCAPTSISDDPIRALRGVRMVSTLNAMFVKDTLEAARTVTIDYNRTSPERVRDEFFKLLASPNPRPAMRRLHGLGLLGQIIPEAAPYVHDVALDSDRLALPGLNGQHLEALKAHLATPTAEGRTRREALNFGLLHVPCRDIKVAEHRARALRLTSAEIGLVGTVVNMVPDRLNAIQPTPNPEFHKVQVYEFMRDAKDCAVDVAIGGWAVAHNQLDVSDSPAPELIDTYFGHYAPNVAPAPFVTGADLIELGHTPGPGMGRLLAKIQLGQMIGAIGSRAQALELCSITTARKKFELPGETNSTC